jgi:hypothetical protein
MKAAEGKEKKVRMAKLVKASEMDRSFDRVFWERVGPQGRFSAAWDMVLEVNAIRGKERREPRLRRSVHAKKTTDRDSDRLDLKLLDEAKKVRQTKGNERT